LFRAVCPNITNSVVGFADPVDPYGEPIDVEARLPFHQCFNTPASISPQTKLPYIADDSACLDIIGNRCCKGNAGRGCVSCCLPESKDSSCTDNTQWHSVGSGIGNHCEACPKDNPWIIFTIVGVISILLAPMLAKFSDVAKHAGAVQGPLLSVLNFFQSADLFLGLDLKWPKAFQWAPRSNPSVFRTLFWVYSLRY
jgi:hypothetical protein